jgi:hypothetical protein
MLKPVLTALTTLATRPAAPYDDHLRTLSALMSVGLWPPPGDKP